MICVMLSGRDISVFVPKGAMRVQSSNPGAMGTDSINSASGLLGGWGSSSTGELGSVTQIAGSSVSCADVEEARIIQRLGNTTSDETQIAADVGLLLEILRSCRRGQK